jgi:signal transduction histidine kinase
VDGACELMVVDALGHSRTTLLTCSPVALHDCALTVCILQDVTELRGLERRVFSEASNEREHISREIHEGLAQELAGISLLLTGVVGRSTSDQHLLGHLSRLVCEAIENSRALAQGLAPVQNALGSLPAALAQLAKEQCPDTGRRVTFQSNVGELPLGPWQAELLFRIARHCTDLALRDPDGGDIAMSLRSTSDSLTLTVTNRAVVNAEHRIEDGLDWGIVAYLTRVLGGTTHVNTLQNGDRCRRVTIPLSVPSQGIVDQRAIS